MTRDEHVAHDGRTAYVVAPRFSLYLPSPGSVIDEPRLDLVKRANEMVREALRMPNFQRSTGFQRLCERTNDGFTVTAELPV
jgi:hypothetical protein